MTQKPFVQPDSIVRKIWGKADIVLFIFAGAAAEFALNKQVDWLYFTGRLPKDPLARMFSTVAYAHRILFMDEESALAAIRQINEIHHSVENQRGAKIPDWAYRDVLYLLIHYSISAFELLERKMTGAEKEEVFRVFSRMAAVMQISEIPFNYQQWHRDRKQQLWCNLESSIYSTDLFLQYKRQLHPLRYSIMRQVQASLAPQQVRDLLVLQKRNWFPLMLAAYKLIRGPVMQLHFLPLLLPATYAQQIRKLNRFHE
jgi:uncharacterized protein (DUF2236 family)